MDGTQTSRKTFAKRARTAGALALCALAWGAAPALADPSVDLAPGTQPVAAAQNIAKTYWGADPCGGQVTIQWMSLPAATNAVSNWSNPVSQYADPAQNTSCLIAFNTGVQWNWTRFCSILVHEYGHLTGHPHTSDPNDVMYAYYQHPVHQCVAAAPAEPAIAADIAPSTPAVPDLTPPSSNSSTNVAARAVVARHHSQRRGMLVVVRDPRRGHGHAGRHHRHTLIHARHTISHHSAAWRRLMARHRARHHRSA